MTVARVRTRSFGAVVDSAVVLLLMLHKTDIHVYLEVENFVGLLMLKFDHGGTGGGGGFELSRRTEVDKGSCSQRKPNK